MAVSGRGARTALVTGAAGQDGVYLSRHLLSRGYRVIGTVRDSGDPRVAAYLAGVEVLALDLCDRSALKAALDRYRPDEIYNLASFSSVGRSWSDPILVHEVNAIAVMALLEEVRRLRDADGYSPRVCQASSSEMFGPPASLPQREEAPIVPGNPYAIAKSTAHFASLSYRRAHGLHVSTAILYNHESPLRPASFVTRKITRAAAEISLGRAEAVSLGNLDVRRDWGSAPDCCRALHLLLQQDSPCDVNIATGTSHSLEEFVALAFRAAGVPDWSDRVRVDPALVRPADIPQTLGDTTRAAALLGWRPELSFAQLVDRMVAADLRRLESGVEHHPEYL